MKKIFKFTGFFLLSCIIIYSVLFIRPYRISGDSMDPNLKHKTIILTDTFLPRVGALKRKNIILYTYGDEVRIKRILGLGNENISIKEGKVYANNVLIFEPYLSPNIRTCSPGSCIDVTEKIYPVPEKSYFVLGDNRENSRDSRGCLDALSCEERAIYYVAQGNVIGKYILALPSFLKIKY